MKKNTVILILIGLTSFYSCKTKEEKVKDVVNEFLTEINDQTKTVNVNLLSENYNDFFSGKRYYTLGKWELKVKPQNDSLIIVEAKGHTGNSLGMPMEIIQGFKLTSELGGWKIFDSYHLVFDALDIELVDVDWKFYWDIDKDEIVNDLMDKLTLEVIKQSHHLEYFPDLVSGKLKLINNSDYDIKRINILIEHFDRNGNSVNTDHTYVSDIVRKKGYREFEWTTGSCNSCFTQKFKINFIRESN